MPGRELAEKLLPVVGGAVVGVLTTLGVLAGLMSTLDEHYVTRREYVATLEGIHAELFYLRTGQVPAPESAPARRP